MALEIKGLQRIFKMKKKFYRNGTGRSGQQHVPLPK